MTKERVKELLSILQAYAEGKTIQYRVIGYEDWHDVDNEEGINEGTRFEYRVKPEENQTEEVLRLSIDTFRCWKCERTFPISERALPMYLSFPPKYACKSCEGVVPAKAKANTPSYRPFLETAELILEWDKKLGDLSMLGRPVEPCSIQEPLIWVKHKVDDRRRLITGFGENFVEIGNKSKPVTMQRLFEMYEFLDGTPCAAKEE